MQSRQTPLARCSLSCSLHHGLQRLEPGIPYLLDPHGARRCSASCCRPPLPPPVAAAAAARYPTLHGGWRTSQRRLAAPSFLQSSAACSSLPACLCGWPSALAGSCSPLAATWFLSTSGELTAAPPSCLHPSLQQTALAIAIIIIVAVHLTDKTSSSAFSYDYVCLLGADVGSSSLCTYTCGRALAAVQASACAAARAPLDPAHQRLTGAWELALRLSCRCPHPALPLLAPRRAATWCRASRWPSPPPSRCWSAAREAGWRGCGTRPKSVGCGSVLLRALALRMADAARSPAQPHAPTHPHPPAPQLQPVRPGQGAGPGGGRLWRGVVVSAGGQAGRQAGACGWSAAATQGPAAMRQAAGQGGCALHPPDRSCVSPHSCHLPHTGASRRA